MGENWEYGDAGDRKMGENWEYRDAGDRKMGKIGNIKMRWLSADVGYWDMGIGRCGNIGIW